MAYKLLFLIFVMTICFDTAAGQNQISNIFRKFRNDEGVKHFNLSGDVTKILQSKGQKLQSQIEEMHVYIFSKNKDVSESDKAKIKTSLTAERFDLLISTRDKDSKITIHGLEKGEVLTNLYSELNVEGMNVYMILKGKIMLAELSKMNFDFEGSSLLKNLKLP